MFGARCEGQQPPWHEKDRLAGFRRRICLQTKRFPCNSDDVEVDPYYGWHPIWIICQTAIIDTQKPMFIIVSIMSKRYNQYTFKSSSVSFRPECVFSIWHGCVKEFKVYFRYDQCQKSVTFLSINYVHMRLVHQQNNVLLL